MRAVSLANQSSWSPAGPDSFLGGAVAGAKGSPSPSSSPPRVQAASKPGSSSYLAARMRAATSNIKVDACVLIPPPTGAWLPMALCVRGVSGWVLG